MRRKKSKKRLKLIVSLATLAIVSFSLSYFYFKKLNRFDTFDESNKYSVRGIDVSHHNPILNWAEIKVQNIHFAYIKATEGITHDDRNYKFNYKLAKDNNVKIGSYHFYSFGVSGREQAKHFIEIAECNSGDLIPAIDVEHSLANPYSKDSAFVQTVIKELKILEDVLYEHYGVHPMIYTNLNCYELYIKDYFPDNLIWISSLSKEPDENINNWVIWQFSHNGELSAHNGKFDLNYFRYGIERLNEICLP